MGFRRSVFALLAFFPLLSPAIPAHADSGIPPVFKNNPINLTLQSGTTLSVTLADLLSSVGGGNALVWSLLGGGIDKTHPAPPAWVTPQPMPATATQMVLSPPTVVHSPPDDPKAPFTFFLSVLSTGLKGGGAIAQVNVTVYTVPVWSKNPVDLGTTPEGGNLNFDLKTVVKDPAGYPLTFSVDDPSKKFPSVANGGWINLEAGTGLLTGSPLRKDVGTFNGFSFAATTASGGTNETAGQGAVSRVFHPPRWTGNPLTLPNGTEDTNYSQTVAGSTYLTYAETNPLTFTVLSGTNNSWLTMDPSTGSLTGHPVFANTGPVTVKVQVSATDNGTTYQDITTFQFNVAVVPKPPALKNPILLPNAFTLAVYGPQDISANASDPHGLPLTWSIVPGSGPTWGSLTATGVFSGTPPASGVNTWTVQVTNGLFPVTATLQVTVKNRPPYWLAKPTILKNGVEDTPYSVNLNPYAKDPQGAPMTFALVGAPSWISIDSSGNLAFTPGSAQVGFNSFQITVSDSIAIGSDTATVQVTIVHTNHAPKWVPNPIQLPDAPERSLYTQDLTRFVTDPDATDTHTYLKLTGPAWAAVSTDGTLSGTLQRGDVGPAVLTVKVTDNGGLSDTATIHLNVVKVPRAPVCQSPITLTASQGTLFNFALSTVVTDLDMETLTYSPLSQPGWMTTGTQGTLSGTPAGTDVGNFAGQFQATNTDGLSCHVDATGQVSRTVFIVVKPIQFTVKERQVFLVGLNDPQYITYLGTGTLTFAPAGIPSWAVLTSNGQLTLSPLHPQIGNQTLGFTVSDGKSTVPGTIQVTVVRDPQLPVWTSPIQFTATATKPFAASVAAYAKDLDGVLLTFKLKTGPAWLTVGSDGSLSGTPAMTDVGTAVVTITASNDGASSDGQVTINVVPPFLPLTWKQNPVLLPNAPVNKAYAQTLASYVVDLNAGATVSFKATAGPSWVFVTTSGLVIGIPSVSDTGLTKITVLATDTVGASASAEVWIQVVPAAGTLKWTKDPIDLGTAYVNSPFSFDLTPYVVDSAGRTVTFRKAAAALPAWLSVSSAGQVSGIPAVTAIGSYTTVFEATDDNVTWFPVNAFGVVKKTSQPLVINASALFFTVRAGEDFTVNLNQPLYVTDPAGNPMSFVLSQAKSWATLTAAGLLEMKPGDPDIGSYVFQLTVIDSTGASAQAPVHVKVIQGGGTLSWKQDPIHFDAIVNKPFTATIADQVNNPDGSTLTFTKLSGPSWFSVSSKGALSGTPLTPSLGENYFAVSVSNASGSAATTVIVRVLPDGPNQVTITIDDPVAGARVDNLWIVDSQKDTCAGESYWSAELKSRIHVYLKALDRAGIHHEGVYLSSDACLYRSPIKDTRGRVLLAWDDRSWLQSFKNRVDLSPGRPEFNSSLVAIWEFLATSVRSVSSPYFETKVPMEMLMVSGAHDQYRNYAHWEAVSGWEPGDFLKYAVNKHKKAGKPLRISGIVPPTRGYHTLIKGTKGKLYPYDSDLSASLRDYAKEVIFRTAVTAKQFIPLLPPPSDPSSIKITLAGQDLPNTKWKYDATKGGIEIFWYLIDLSTLHPGDQLVIQFQPAG